jgi:hypothetical protein
VEKVFKNAVKLGGKNWVILECDLFEIFPFIRKIGNYY